MMMIMMVYLIRAVEWMIKCSFHLIIHIAFGFHIVELASFHLLSCFGF